MSWAGLWAVVFWTVLALFAVLAVAVTIGGVGDLRALFRALDERSRDRAQRP